MNQDNNRSCNYELLPLAVIEAAHAGDPSAMDRVLRHYDRYIKKLCTRKLYDDCGQEHYCVDEYMKRHLEIKLITAIVNMKLIDYISSGLKAAYPFPRVLPEMTNEP